MQCRRPLIALLLGLIALLPAACGGGDSGGRPLSRTAASELRAGLDSVQQEIDAGDCEAATASALELEQRTAELPSRVDSDLRDALERGVARLGNLVREHCQAEQSEQGSTGPTEPPVAETGPTGQETSPTDEGKQKDEGKKEKPSKDGKGKNQDENGGSQGLPGDTPPSDGGQGQSFGTDDNQDSGGATP